MARMEKAEGWQSPAVPAAVGGPILLLLGFAFCGGSKTEAPPAPPPRSARAVAPPALTSSPLDELPAATIVAAPEVAQAPVTKVEATAMLAELHQLEKVGHEMDGNRYSGDLTTATDSDMAGQRRCMDAMRDARPRLEKVTRARPRSPTA